MYTFIRSFTSNPLTYLLSIWDIALLRLKYLRCTLRAFPSFLWNRASYPDFLRARGRGSHQGEDLDPPHSEDIDAVRAEGKSRVESTLGFKIVGSGLHFCLKYLSHANFPLSSG
jgi:hypothetical protein